MVSKKLAVAGSLVLAIALPGAVFGAPQTKPAAKKAPAVAKPAAAKPAPAAKPAAKPTLEANMKALKTAPNSAVVAVVGGQKITKGELMLVMWDWAAPMMLDEYINTVVINQALKKNGVQVTDADIKAKVDEIVKTQLPPGESLESTLQRMKTPMARFKSSITLQLALEKIIEQETKPSDAEYAEFIKARHILVSASASVGGPNATPEDKTKAEQAAKEKADKILAEIKGGKAFDAAAKEYSDDAMTKQAGGDLGWFRKGEQFQEVSNVAFTLKAGDVSDPVKTFRGYHIVKVDKLGRDASVAEKKDLRAKLVKSKMGMRMREIFDELKAKANIQNNLNPALPEPAKPKAMMPPAGARPMPPPANAAPAAPKPATVKPTPPPAAPPAPPVEAPKTEAPKPPAEAPQP